MKPAKSAAHGTLKLRRLRIDTCRENVAFLHRQCARSLAGRAGGYAIGRAGELSKAMGEP